jgi:hypothetical protein
MRQILDCNYELYLLANLIILVKKNQGKQWGLRFKIFGDFFFLGTFEDPLSLFE